MDIIERRWSWRWLCGHLHRTVATDLLGDGTMDMVHEVEKLNDQPPPCPRVDRPFASRQLVFLHLVSGQGGCMAKCYVKANNPRYRCGATFELLRGVQHFAQKCGSRRRKCCCTWARLLCRRFVPTGLSGAQSGLVTPYFANLLLHDSHGSILAEGKKYYIYVYAYIYICIMILG